MKYKTYLKNKNLSKNTIITYTEQAEKWMKYLNNRNASKTLFIKYINKYSITHKPNSIRLVYASIMQFLKFQKKWKLFLECKDIKLPSQILTNRVIVGLEEFDKIKTFYKINSWYDRRNWLIFLVLFTTGIRVNELNSFKVRKISNNRLYLKCKGNKFRTIYINDFLEKELLLWNRKFVNIQKNDKLLSNKQIVVIVKNIGYKYFQKEITPHSLRRSYATNLLRAKIDLKIVSNMLGHANINTTARYIHLTEDEMFNQIKNVF